MVMQAGMGVSRIILLFGAGYTGTVLFKNGKLSDALDKLQSLVKGYEKKGENRELDVSDAMANQVRRLAMEVRQLASARQITVLNGDSGNGGLATSNGKILTLEGKKVQEQLKLSAKTQGLLASSEAPSLKGLKDIADSLRSEDVTRSIVDGNVEKLADQLRRLMRYWLELRNYF